MRRDVRFLSTYTTNAATAKRHTLELKVTNEILKDLVKERKSGGEALAKAAVILLLAPDPITGIAAIPVLAASRILKIKDRNRSDFARLFETASSDFRTLFSSSDIFP